jgi:hypothetical protein
MLKLIVSYVFNLPINCSNYYLRKYWFVIKDKSPEVPFHGISLPYSYFEVI